MARVVYETSKRIALLIVVVMETLSKMAVLERKSHSLWRMEVDTGLVTSKSIMGKLQLHSCLNLRQLAALHGVNVADKGLVTAVAHLKRKGCIRPTGSLGRHVSFVLATFDTRV